MQNVGVAPQPSPSKGKEPFEAILVSGLPGELRRSENPLHMFVRQFVVPSRCKAHGSSSNDTSA